METALNDKTQGAVNIFSTAVPYHSASLCKTGHGCCFWVPKSGWGTHASLLPAVLSGNSALVSSINHPGMNLDLHMETFILQTPPR